MYVLGDIRADVVLGVGAVAGVSTRAVGVSEEEVRRGSDEATKRRRGKGKEHKAQSTKKAC